MSAPAWSRARIEARVRELSPWFHDLDLDGVRTAPDHFLGDYPRAKWQRFAHALPADLRGRTVLDVGCNAGFHAIELKRRGADRVVGIDTDPRYLAQAAFAAEIAGVAIELRELSVYDVARLGERFDVVLFLGVLYHLRHPLLALDLLHEHVARELLVFQSMLRGAHEPAPVEDDYPFAERAIFERAGHPRMAFVERAYAGDPTNWWIPNRACALAMLRAAGFAPEATPDEEVAICRRVENPSGDGAVYPARGGP